MFILCCVIPNGNVHWQIGPFQSTKVERAKLKVKVRLNLHGIVSVESATVSFGDSFWGFSLLDEAYSKSFANLF